MLITLEQIANSLAVVLWHTFGIFWLSFGITKGFWFNCSMIVVIHNIKKKMCQQYLSAFVWLTKRLVKDQVGAV